MKTKQHIIGIALIVVLLIVVSFIGVSVKNRIAGLSSTSPDLGSLSSQTQETQVVPELEELEFLKPQVESLNDGQKLIYSREVPNEKNQEIIFTTPGSQEKIEIKKDQVLSQNIFISPDRKYLAVTVEPNEEYIFTYITDLGGRIIVKPHTGYFIAWSNDSQKTILYVSDLKNELGTGTRIYYLDLDGSYYDSGLPEGTTSTDLSKNNSIAYSLKKDSGGSPADLYIRDFSSNDRLLLDGDTSSFAWLRWSPDGEKIAFMRYDTKKPGKFGKQTLWLISKDGSEQKEISSIQWNYPPVWSPDGSKILFADQGNIWEYNINNDFKKKITTKDRDFIQQPNYSLDSNIVVFSDGEQIWSVEGGIEKQLTSGVGEKSYPILIK